MLVEAERLRPNLTELLMFADYVTTSSNFPHVRPAFIIPPPPKSLSLLFFYTQLFFLALLNDYPLD
jgi:hypothetical protein